MKDKINTIYGKAKLQKDGYYYITSGKEGNYGKLLHRLIARDYFGDWIDEPDPNGDTWIIHHVNSDKTYNCVLNLEPMSRADHQRLHNIGEYNPNYNGLSDETKIKISEARNTSGYFRVDKHKCKRCKQGFLWRYKYFEDGKQKCIYSVSLEKLKAKVKAKGLKWMKL